MCERHLLKLFWVSLSLHPMRSWQCPNVPRFPVGECHNNQNNKVGSFFFEIYTNQSTSDGMKSNREGMVHSWSIIGGRQNEVKYIITTNHCREKKSDRRVQECGRWNVRKIVSGSLGFLCRTFLMTTLVCHGFYRPTEESRYRYLPGYSQDPWGVNNK